MKKKMLSVVLMTFVVLLFSSLLPITSYGVNSPIAKEIGNSNPSWVTFIPGPGVARTAVGSPCPSMIAFVDKVVLRCSSIVPPSGGPSYSSRSFSNAKVVLSSSSSWRVGTFAVARIRPSRMSAASVFVPPTSIPTMTMSVYSPSLNAICHYLPWYSKRCQDSSGATPKQESSSGCRRYFFI